MSKTSKTVTNEQIYALLEQILQRISLLEQQSHIVYPIYPYIPNTPITYMSLPNTAGAQTQTEGLK